MFFAHTNSSAQGQYQLQLNNFGQVYFVTAGANGSPGSFESPGIWNVSNASVPLNQWSYISVTYDGSAVRLYIDGVLDFTHYIIDYFPNNYVGEFYIGQNGNQNMFFDGLIDGINVWNIALDSNQIQEYMLCPPIGSEIGLVGYWNFEEGSGSTVFDQTSNGNDGTINGATYDTNVPPQSCQLTSNNGCDSVAVLNLTITTCPGCTDSLANNYNPFATIEDSTCLYSTFVFGCTDSTALNYDPLATVDDSSCCYSSGQLWSQIGQDIDGLTQDDELGYSVSLNSLGNILAVGAPHDNTYPSNTYLNSQTTGAGAVRVYEKINGIWSQLGQTIYAEAQSDYFGGALSLSSDGSILAIGAKFNDDSGIDAGHVRIFENIGGTWIQIGQDIDGEAANDESGTSVSLSSDGSIVAIGAPTNDGNGFMSGHVRVFENIFGVWIQIGQDINGEAIDDFFGYKVSLSSNGNIVAIGGPNNDGNGSYSGHVRIYENIGGTWIQVGQDIDGATAGELSGCAIDLNNSGNIIAIGAKSNSTSGTRCGQVRIFENISGVWTIIGQALNGEFPYDESGYSVSLSSNGNIVSIGAIFNNGNGSNSGHVRVYENIGGSWSQIGQDIDGEAAGDQSGRSVSLSSDGNTVAIGAPRNDGNGIDAGHVRVFQMSTPCSDLGCLDPLALNFDPYATVDDSSCVYPNYGCIDSV